MRSVKDGAAPLVATGSQTVGPFFHFGLTADGTVNASAPPLHLPRIELLIRVLDGRGDPVADAVVEIFYAAVPGQPCQFARLPTGGDGACTFEIAQPVESEGDPTGASAPHVNLCLFARGLLRHLHSRIYFEGDTALARDPLLRMVDADRRTTLLARRDAGGANRWRFEVRLQGPGETVFFDA